MEHRTWQKFLDKLADKLLDTGNITLGALVVGQFLGGQPFSLWLAVGGVVAWLGLLGLSYLCTRWAGGE
jgi:hypothetical protein